MLLAQLNSHTSVLLSTHTQILNFVHIPQMKSFLYPSSPWETSLRLKGSGDKINMNTFSFFFAFYFTASGMHAMLQAANCSMAVSQTPFHCAEWGLAMLGRHSFTILHVVY